MNRFLLATIILFVGPLLAYSQNEVQSFGKVDVADLELKECPFEKDANAMVLFDQGDLYFDHQFDVVLAHHKRIKIFNQKAKDEGNIRIEFYSFEKIIDVSAQTINYEGGKPVITKVDKKQIFTEVVDKSRSALVFSFPNVQDGSILEFKYKRSNGGYIPTWFFQSDIPSRYSELKTAIPEMLVFRPHFRVKYPFAKNKKSSETRTGYSLDTHLYAMKDVPSLPTEPFMTSRFDNLESVIHQLVMIKPIGGFVKSFNDTWKKVAEELLEDEDFGLQLKKKISDEEVLISKAKLLKTDDEKIKYLFNEVKNNMKQNGLDRYYTINGTNKAWEKKVGTATEINLILYRLLKQSGVPNTYPMLVSTRDNGKVNIAFPSLYQFDRTVVYIPVDSLKSYVLDASEKYNSYNIYPENFLNSYGFYVDRETKSGETVSLTSSVASRKSVFLTAEIKPEGKLAGKAQVACFGYNKLHELETFKKDGEEKLKERFTTSNNGLKIKALQLEGADVDSVQLSETLDFDLELTGSDGTYIYFNPNLFTNVTKNPFLSENRVTTIDFGYNNRVSLVGSFKIPAGFKAEGLPPNINFVMPDKSIVFQRVVAEAEGQISVRYSIDFKKSVYTTDEYPMLRQFYKQMLEMLNEQVVLKKS
ncbi:DUF3857 domain-containing protein [Pedobacter sp. SYSU D00535]|uniref:DUF3857 domain-containing protein n=1 Tax=Pedobacter sp. SYSU D00535 TaxID=2810308 RepID=UPI001A96EFF1|nr:DUF3857 domain-containing protein [Pedobacter sp. SYSU D00535]